MAQRFVVHTDCPTCGAPLDFSEGANAIRCGHCRSNLLVTGRKQVLSYWIPPRVAARGAVQVARFAESGGRPARLLDPQLWFVPYYRLTGHDFRWVRESVVQEERPPIAFGPDGEAVSSSSSFAYSITRTRDELRFRDRHVEKNFIACRLEGFGAYSLGVRAAVLQLQLFQKSELEAHGRIADPHLDGRAAMEHGLKSAGLDRAIHREVLGRVLSLVYFPFWLVPFDQEGQRRVTVVDGVSESITGRGLPGSVLEALRQTAGPAPPTIGFRPLACPNCGWDLPLRPDDVVFVCTSCHRAWGIRGDRLLPTKLAIASTALGDVPKRYLPLWAFRAKLPDETKGRRFLVPGFRYRRLKMLADLATNLARAQPLVTLEHRDTEIGGLTGCYFDAEDATTLCRFVAAGLGSRSLVSVERFRTDQVRTAEPVLLWAPFREGPHSLYDPYSSTALPKNLLL